jgi:porin
MLCGVAYDSAAATLARGLQVGVDYLQDYLRDVAGGLDRAGAGPGAVFLSATDDGRAWGGSKDNVFNATLIGLVGGSVTDAVGSLQAIDGIEGFNTVRVYLAWYQHTFGESGVSLRLGLQDYSLTFHDLNSADLFINNSFAIDAIQGQANVSQFPVTTVGGVVRWHAQNGFYLLGGVFDGRPGVPGHPAGTQIQFGHGSGVFGALEAGIQSGNAYKVGIGGWGRTGERQIPDGATRHRNHGFYIIGEKRLLGGYDRRPALSAFAKFGIAEPSRNTLDRFVSAGLTLTGFIAQRSGDTLGLGMVRARTSAAYRRANPGSPTAETILELTYKAHVKDYLNVQPDVQYVIHPASEPHISNAWVLGVRAELTF